MNLMTDPRSLGTPTSGQAAGGKVRMTPGEAFVETLVAHHVKDVFGVAGAACMDALELFLGAGIRSINAAHEENAAHMADGYARVTNWPAVCIARSGSSANYLAGAVAAASHSSASSGMRSGVISPSPPAAARSRAKASTP